MTLIKADALDPSFFAPRTFASDVRSAVQHIIDEVKQNGDAVLHEFAKKFDRADPDSFEIPYADLKECENNLRKNKTPVYDALCRSRDLALKFAYKQKECFTDFEIELTDGLFTGQKNIPVERAGLYVPAGSFPLLSSVVMTSSPAKAAGCKEIILCTPPKARAKTGRTEKQSPWADEGILAAASICSVGRVFAVGGAQAIAAMAYGTQSVPRCDVIAGPGNKYVAEAKRLITGDAGIDLVAGPTEVFIIADKDAKAEWVAADLLAQAEHDADAQAVLATPSKAFAEKVNKELEKRLAALPTAQTAGESIKRHGLIIITDSLQQAADIANRKAPEHLELAITEGKKRDELAALLHNYGSLFIGCFAAEVLGDYAAGLNHTLPTSGSARFTGGLSVRHFLKTATTLRAAENKAELPKGVKDSFKAAFELGKAEGLYAHARAADVRLQS